MIRPARGRLSSFHFFLDFPDLKLAIVSSKEMVKVDNNRSLPLTGMGRHLQMCLPWVAVAILSMAGPCQGAEPMQPPSETALWTNGIGVGFPSGVQTLTLEVGGAYGLEILGSRQSHHLALGSLSYGYTPGPLFGGDHWYQRNWELRAELFGGMEFSPDDDWLVGLTPHLRYNLTTGTRWVPFIDGGAGVTATDIGQPDLSSTFEFNVQGGIGVHWFAHDNLALTLEARYFHMSDDGITSPNLGVNGVIGMIGLTWFF